MKFKLTRLLMKAFSLFVLMVVSMEMNLDLLITPVILISELLI